MPVDRRDNIVTVVEVGDQTCLRLQENFGCIDLSVLIEWFKFILIFNISEGNEGYCRSFVKTSLNWCLTV